MANAVELSQIAAGVGGFIINGELVEDGSGFSISDAGDVNGDGLADLIVGAPYISSGKSYVVFGKTNGTAVNLSQVASGTGGFVINGETVGDRSGFSVSDAGDVNGDGLADLIVGTPYASSSGKSYVVFGKTNGTAVNLSQVASGTGGFVINGESAEDGSGFSVSGAGDVNGDGLDDLIIGAPYASSFSGKSYVVFGKANSAAINLSQVSTGTGGFVIRKTSPESSGVDEDNFGFSVSGAGDVNGDGLDDLIIGAPGALFGESYVVFGKTNGTAVDLDEIAIEEGRGFLITGEYSNEAFGNSGFSVSGAGDVNGDGLDDLIIGAPYASSSGKSYVVFGKANRTGVSLSQVASGQGGFVINGEASDDGSGFSVSGAGDVNGDGLDDLIVGAPYASPGGRRYAGKSYVVLGKADGAEVELGQIVAGVGGFVVNGESTNNFSGTSVSGAGDVNGDGFADLLVGADSTSKSYVIFGGNFTTTAVSQQGSPSHDILTATANSQVLIGAQGDDQISDGGFSDLTIYGGSGDDLIRISNSNFKYIDGGSGKDTIEASFSFSLASTANVEWLKLTGNATQGTGNALDNFLQGNALNNTLSGGDGNDTLSGRGGANTLIGGKGSDTYYIESANDVIVEEAQGGTDYVYAFVNFTLVNTNHVEVVYLIGNAVNGTGNALNNALWGNDRDNILEGGDGNDALRGLNGRDTLIGGNGNDTYFLDDLANDIIVEQANGGRDTIQVVTDFSLANLADVERLVFDPNYYIQYGTGNSLDNELVGNDYSNELKGENGNDILNGGTGADTLIGGLGNDTYYVDRLEDVVQEAINEGTDRIHATSNYSLAPASSIEELVLQAGASAALTAAGNEFNNTITGNEFDNTLLGEAGNDILVGGLGNDSLLGGVGDDNLNGNAGNDTVYGNDGIDYIWGSDGNDMLSGDGNNDSLNGESGDDIVLGGLGDDGLEGGDGNDTLKGDGGNDVLLTGHGSDYLEGGDGNDQLIAQYGDGIDTFIGGLGDDYYAINFANIAIVVEQAGQGTDTVGTLLSLSLMDLKDSAGNVADIENLAAALPLTRSLTLSGNSLNNTITGSNGDDIIVGREGNDVIMGGIGNDNLNGNDGNDVVNGNDGIDYIWGGNGNDTLSGDEGNDSLNGEAGDDSIAGGLGDDGLQGGTGNDTLNGNDGNDNLIGEDGNDILKGNIGNDLLITGHGSDYLEGGDGDDQLIVQYDDGIDTFVGGLGNDYYAINFANLAVVIELAGQGIDTVGTLLDMDLNQLKDSAGNIADIENLAAAIPLDRALVLLGNNLNNTITGSHGNDILEGKAGDDTLLGEAGNDTLIGGEGNDNLHGSTLGADLMVGGVGNDTYHVGQTEDTVSESVTDGGIDWVITAISYNLESIGANVAGIENIQLWNWINALNATGNALNNTIVGNSYNNVLEGKAGDDALFGEAGDDTLLGGEGNDILHGSSAGIDFMAGGAGNDTYHTGSEDSISETVADGGVDLIITGVSYNLEAIGANVAGIENIQLWSGAGAINAVGNVLSNTMVGNSYNNVLEGKAGDDFLYGEAGNDTLIGGDGNDTLHGSTPGVDLMVGGAGNDIYHVGSEDSISETVADGGIDWVITGISYNLEATGVSVAGVENLELWSGAGAIDATGNALNNTIAGNSYNNTLDGKAGDDIIVGGLGDDILQGGNDNDILIGGAGADQYWGGVGVDNFQLDRSSTDTINDIESTDHLRISVSDFSNGGLVAGQTLRQDQLLVGTGATAATTALQRFIYNTATGALFYDADGTGSFSSTQIGILNNKPTMLATSQFAIVA